MKNALIAIVALALLVPSVALAQQSAAPTHRNGCHTKHACPSDHATYRWSAKKLLCVKPTSDKRTAAFKIKVKYAGLNYLCKK